MVEFLNTQMNPAEVIAIEIRQYIGQGLKTLVPRVLGQTPKAEYKTARATGDSKQWDEASFLKALEQRRPDEADVARSLLTWAQQRGLRIWWGNGKSDGSFFPMLDYEDHSYWLISVWTYGRIEIQFQMLKKAPPFDAESKRLELRERLNKIPGISIHENAITRRPSISLSLLKDAAVFTQFTEVVDWVIQEIKTQK